MSAISVSGLVKRFGAYTAVDGVSFAAPSGEVTALLGPNGAGKTTTIEILEGFQAPTSGTVRVLGTDPRRGGRAWRARIGLVLPAALAAHLDPAAGELTLPSADVTADLGALVLWARDNHVDLTSLEVGAPSLEDAYLAITGRQDSEGALSHGRADS